MSAPLLYRMFKSKTNHPLHSAIRLKREDVVFLYLVEKNSEVSVFIFRTIESGQKAMGIYVKTSNVLVTQTFIVCVKI